MVTKKTTKKNEVATTSKGGVPAKNYGSYGNAGWEHVDSTHFKKPWLGVLQDNSKQVKKKNEQYIDGAEVGMFYNTATRQLYNGEKGITIIPCFADQKIVERTPKVEGGGGNEFVAEYPLGHSVVREAIEANGGQKKGIVNTETKNPLFNTFFIYANRIEDVDAEEIEESFVISFSVSKIYKYQEIMTRLRTYKHCKNTPLFANRIKLTSFTDSNRNGQEFQNFHMEPAIGDDLEASMLPEDSPLLEVCHALAESVKAGETTVDYSTEMSDAASASGDTDGHF